MPQEHRHRYVQRFTDRHGKVWTYFRRGAAQRIRLPNDPDSPEFEAAYSRALAAIPVRFSRVRLAIESRDWRETIPDGPAVGVYLLLLKGELVYIGTSRKMRDRVADHRKHGREFDQVFYIAAEETERRKLETLLIRRLRPSANRIAGKRKLQLVPRIARAN